MNLINLESLKNATFETLDFSVVLPQAHGWDRRNPIQSIDSWQHYFSVHKNKS